jgi:drug/metabolite transporter (DMT)-like permease
MTDGPSAATPLLLALLAAALFGAQAVLARRSLRHVDPQTGAMITICTSTLVFWSVYLWRMEPAHWRSAALWVFLSNGLLHPVLSMFLSFEANRRMGATLSATIAATTPLFATAGAVLGLREGLSLELVLGTLGIVLGIVVLSWVGSATRGWPLAALAFPTGAALVRAFNHVWGRFGMLLLPAPLFAATLSFSVSAMLAVGTYGARFGRLPTRLPRRGLAWGALSGLTVSGAILSMYSALATGGVVVVSPIVSTYPVFTLLFSLLFRQEAFSRRILAGVALVVGGVLLIGLR